MDEEENKFVKRKKVLTEEQREERNRKSREYMRKRRREDAEYRAKQAARKREYRRKRYHTDPEYEAKVNACIRELRIATKAQQQQPQPGEQSESNASFPDSSNSMKPSFDQLKDSDFTGNDDLDVIKIEIKDEDDVEEFFAQLQGGRPEKVTENPAEPPKIKQEAAARAGELQAAANAKQEKPKRVLTEERKRKMREYMRKRRREDAEFRAKVAAQNRKYQRKRYHTDPEFRAKMIAKQAEYRRKRKQEDPEFRAKVIARQRERLIAAKAQQQQPGEQPESSCSFPESSNSMKPSFDQLEDCDFTDNDDDLDMIEMKIKVEDDVEEFLARLYGKRRPEAIQPHIENQPEPKIKEEIKEESDDNGSVDFDLIDQLMREEAEFDQLEGKLMDS